MDNFFVFNEMNDYHKTNFVMEYIAPRSGNIEISDWLNRIIYEIKDEYGTFPVVSHDDCTTTILNGNKLNLLDEMPSIKGVEAFRLNFTTESAEEVYDVIKAAQAKLDGRLHTSLFNQETDTRGHFNKEII